MSSSEGKDILVKTIDSIVARLSGTRTSQPSILTGQKKTALSVQDVIGLPEVFVPPCQILDPDDPDFGEFYWMADYDPPI